MEDGVQMFKILRNKLICILLMVIIIINTFLPSVCYGEIDLEGADILEGTLNTNSNILLPYKNDDTNKPDIGKHLDFILMQLHIELDTNVTNVGNYEQAKEEIENNRRFLYDMCMMLKVANVNEGNFSDDQSELYNILLQNIYQNNSVNSTQMVDFPWINTIQQDYYNNLYDYLGDYGTALYIMLVYQRHISGSAEITEYNGYTYEEIR